MSTEISDPAEGMRARPKRDRTFVRRLSVTSVALVVLAGILTAANLTQGPHVDSVEANLDNLVDRSGQRVVLHLDQPVENLSSDDVAVSPSASVTATASGAAITLQFDGILRYDTQYDVTLTDVAGSFSGAESTLEYSFTTPDSEIFYLHRDDRVDHAGTKYPDTLYEDSLTPGAGSSVVFQAPRIQDYVALSNMLVVVTLDDDDTNTMNVVPFDGSPVVTIALPGEGFVHNLGAAGSRNLIGYTFTSATGTGEKRFYERSLFVYDLTGSTGLPQEITGLGGAPLSVADWVFVPETTSIVAQAADSSLYLVNPLDAGSVSPLGQHTEIRGFIPGTKQLIVADPDRGSTIDLATGETSVLLLPESHLSDSAYPGKLVVLDADGRYARMYSEYSGSDPQLTFEIALTDAAGSQVVYQPEARKSRIQDFCVAPNGHYLAVETVSKEGMSDDYPNQPAFSATTTVIVDLETGASTRSFSGTRLSWCT